MLKISTVGRNLTKFWQKKISLHSCLRHGVYRCFPESAMTPRAANPSSSQRRQSVAKFWIFLISSVVLRVHTVTNFTGSKIVTPVNTKYLRLPRVCTGLRPLISLLNLQPRESADVFNLSRLYKTRQFRLIIKNIIANCELGLSLGVFTKSVTND